MASSELIEDCCQKAEQAESDITQVITDIRKSLGAICGVDDFEPLKEEEEDDQLVNTMSKGSFKEIAADGLSSAEHSRWRERFDRLDTDNSGKVGFMELKELLEEERKKPISDAEMEQLMKDYDFNQDGRLDFDEFLVLRAFSAGQKLERFKARAHEIVKSSSLSEQNYKDRVQTVHIKGVPKVWVKRYLRKELDETSACLQLPWAAAIFVFFGISAAMHFKFDILYGLDQAITFDIEENANFAFSGIVPYENGRMGHKNIYDVNTIADFWSWMSMGLVPIFWPQSWDVSEVRANVQAKCMDAKVALQGFGWPSQNLNFTPGPADIASSCPEDLDTVQWSQPAERYFGQRKVDGHYLVHSSIVGGVRMRQERVPAEACPTADEDGKAHAGLCIPDTLGYWLAQEFTRLLQFETKFENLPGGETVYLLSRQQQSDVRDVVRGLEDRMWFSPETAKIEILFTVYSPRHNVLTATFIYLVLNEAGHIHKKLDPFSFWLNPYSSPVLYVIDIIWLLLTFKLFLEESWEIFKHVKQLGCAKGIYEYIDVSNFVDWVSIMYAVSLIIMWVIYVGRLGEITDLMKQGNPALVGTWADASIREQFYIKVHAVTQYTIVLRVCLACYPFVIVSRFFKAFSAQARLAMVTETLTQAAVDIFHFAVVFGCVFLVYTLSAMILWGGEKEYFSNFARAFNSVFRLMLGDFDWEEMHDVGRAPAVLWFWTFTWLVNLIMLNMLLAIIMDVYTDVKSGVGEAPTLWAQAAEIYYREKMVRQGKHMRLSTVLDLLDPTALDEDDGDEEDENTLIRVETLSNDYGVKINQAEEILLEAEVLQRKEVKKENIHQLSEHRTMIRIENKVVQMHRFLEAFVRSRASGQYVSRQGSPRSNWASTAPREVEL